MLLHHILHALCTWHSYVGNPVVINIVRSSSHSRLVLATSLLRISVMAKFKTFKSALRLGGIFSPLQHGMYTCPKHSITSLPFRPTPSLHQSFPGPPTSLAGEQRLPPRASPAQMAWGEGHMVWTRATEKGLGGGVGAIRASWRWALMDEANFLMAWTQATEKGGGGGELVRVGHHDDGR